MISRIICSCTDRVDVIVDPVMTLNIAEVREVIGIANKKKVTGCSLIGQDAWQAHLFGKTSSKSNGIKLQMSPFHRQPLDPGLIFKSGWMKCISTGTEKFPAQWSWEDWWCSASTSSHQKDTTSLKYWCVWNKGEWSQRSRTLINWQGHARETILCDTVMVDICHCTFVKA